MGLKSRMYNIIYSFNLTVLIRLTGVSNCFNLQLVDLESQHIFMIVEFAQDGRNYFYSMNFLFIIIMWNFFLRMRDDVVKAKGISGKYLASFSTEFVNPHNF